VHGDFRTLPGLDAHAGGRNQRRDIPGLASEDLDILGYERRGNAGGLGYVVGPSLSPPASAATEEARDRRELWVGVGALDFLHGVFKGGSDVLGCRANVVPVAAVGELEAVDLFEVAGVGVAVELGGFGSFFVPAVTDSLEEEEREDVALPIGAIDGGAAEDVGGFPEGGFELFAGECCGRIQDGKDLPRLFGVYRFLLELCLRHTSP
jgi:hypothetical protein